MTACKEMIEIDSIPASTGTYVLVLESRRNMKLQIGRFGILGVIPGFYLYVGSAFGPGGLRARLGRHMQQNKTCRWHIDYLRRITRLREVWYDLGPEKQEPNWAQVICRLPGASIPLQGFGATDRRGENHLVYAASVPASELFEQELQRGSVGDTLIQCLRIS